jgi:hypothetical protein
VLVANGNAGQITAFMLSNRPITGPVFAVHLEADELPYTGDPQADPLAGIAASMRGTLGGTARVGSCWSAMALSHR